MAKKDKNQEIVFSPDTNDVKVDDEPLFESEAYGTPQPEAGSDVTVMKPVGIGGPVPIVAPKHNTIQLQPIVVPLAVVPYMTQDSNVLRTDGKQQGGYMPSTVEYGDATEFETVSTQKKIKKRAKVQPRIFALVTFLVAAVTVLPFILSYFMNSIGALDITKYNVIGVIMGWVKDGFNARPLRNFAFIGVAAVEAVLVITSLISIIVGKYPRAFTFILSLGSAAAMLAYLIKLLVKKQFVLGDEIALVVLVALTLLNFVLTIVFSCVLNNLDDKVEDSNRTAREI